MNREAPGGPRPDDTSASPPRRGPGENPFAGLALLMAAAGVVPALRTVAWALAGLSAALAIGFAVARAGAGRAQLGVAVGVVVLTFLATPPPHRAAYRGNVPTPDTVAADEAPLEADAPGAPPREDEEPMEPAAPPDPRPAQPPARPRPAERVAAREPDRPRERPKPKAAPRTAPKPKAAPTAEPKPRRAPTASRAEPKAVPRTRPTATPAAETRRRPPRAPEVATRTTPRTTEPRTTRRTPEQPEQAPAPRTPPRRTPEPLAEVPARRAPEAPPRRAAPVAAPSARELSEIRGDLAVAQVLKNQGAYYDAGATLRGALQSVSALSARYPGSPAVAELGQRVRSLAAENRRACFAEAAVFRSRGEATSPCP